MNDVERTPRILLFGITLDGLRMSEVVKQLLDWTVASEGFCQYVVTPNVDHVVMLQEDEALRAAYKGASLILADGMPVVLAARLLGKNIPQRLAGSDIVPALFDEAQKRGPLTTFLLGASPGVGDRAAVHIQQRWPQIKVVGTYSPPLGFEYHEAENTSIMEQISAAQPDVLIIGLGAPKQELWVHAHQQQINAPVALCVGATIDFLAGEKPRAPLWMQLYGLEWLHRCASEPRRLLFRYARDACIFPKLVWREWKIERNKSRVTL